MDVAVIGATGRTGIRVVEALAQQGHQVRALVRSPEKGRGVPAGIEVVEGDATHEVAMSKVVAGVDAVIDVAGPSKAHPVIREAITSNLLAALETGGRRRVLMLTGAGVRFPEDVPKLIDRLIVGALRRLQGAVLADGEAAVRLLASSDHDWTVVRVPRLVQAPSERPYRIVSHVGPDSGTQIDRPQLAAALVEILESQDWNRRAPVVSR